jgi:hypothetical protein
MSARRVGLRNRFRYGIGVTAAARHMNVSAGPDTVATCEPPPAPMKRIRHEAIPSPSHKCYRVIRCFVLGDVAGIEDIGTFKDATSALLLINREEGRAQALDLNGRVIGDNLRPMEKR